MGNKSTLIIAVILVLVAIFGGGFLWWSMRTGASSVEPTERPIPIASPEVMPTPEETPIMEETKSDLEQIKEAFAEKYDKPLGDVDVNISENTGTYASGGVRFVGEISGAMWLAYNDGEKWIIVFDGQGTIPCLAVDPYDFPTDMVPECWNEATSTLIQR